MLALFKDLALALFPTQESGEAAHTFRWRQTVAVCMITLGFLMVLHVAWACGLLVGFGLNGFAWAVDVETVRQQNTNIRAGQIDREIIDARRDQCIALASPTMVNEDARIYNARRLADQLTQYRELTGKEYVRVPECSELVSAVPSIPVAPPPATSLPITPR